MDLGQLPLPLNVILRHTFIYGEIRKAIRVEFPEATVWFYRDQSREVDFVFEHGLKAHLIDEKWKEVPSAKDFHSLIETKKLFKHAKEQMTLLCRTKAPYHVGPNMQAVSAFELRETLRQVYGVTV